MNPRQVVGQIRAELYPNVGHPCPTCRQVNPKVSLRFKRGTSCLSPKQAIVLNTSNVAMVFFFFVCLSSFSL